MKAMHISSNNYNLKNKSTNRFPSNVQVKNNISFCGASMKSKIFEPTRKAYNGFMEPVESKVAQWFVKLLETKTVEKLVKKTNSIKPSVDKNGNTKKFTDKLTSHLIVLGSTILSGFYILKTLNNKHMDEDKRKTLAINQGLVYIASTIMAYTFDDWARKKTNPYIDAFKKANASVNPERLEKMVSGMKLARAIITIDVVYRFIAPVLVTPLANYIGNKLQEKSEAELAVKAAVNNK